METSFSPKVIFLLCMIICIGNGQISTKTSAQSYHQTTHGVPWLQKRINAEKRKLDLFNASASLFEAKQLYDKGIQNSYDHFNSSSTIKEYLIKTQRRIYKGNVLPHRIKLTNLTTLLLVDTSIEALHKDITGQEQYKISYRKTVSRNVSGHVNFASFPTSRPYNVTRISYTLLENKKTIFDVGVNVEQLLAFPMLQLNLEGKIIDCKILDGTKPLKSIQPSKVLANFSENELKLQTENMLTFWKILGISGTTVKILNENHSTYKAMAMVIDSVRNVDVETDTMLLINDQGVCYNRMKLQSCAVLINNNGSVVSVNPDEFINVYKTLNPPAKTAIAKLVRRNIDKIKPQVKGNSGSAETMKTLIMLESLNIHISLVESSGRAQNPERYSRNKFTTGIEVLSAILGEIPDSSLSGGDVKVKLSGSKVVLCIARSNVEKNIPKGRSIRDITFSESAQHNLDVFDDSVSAASTLTSTISVISDLAGDETDKKVYSVTGLVLGQIDSVVSGLKDEKLIKEVTSQKVGSVTSVLGAIKDIAYNAYKLEKSIKRYNSADNKFDKNDAIADMVTEGLDIIFTLVNLFSDWLPPNVGFAVKLAVEGLKLLRDFAVGIFKTFNEVDKVNSQIPLTPSEKPHEFFARLFSGIIPRQRNYIDQLVEEDSANLILVDNMADILKKDLSIGTIVFPSTTKYYDGTCTLSHVLCYAKLSTCLTYTKEHERVIDETKCNHLQPCGDYSRVCADYDGGGYFNYNEYRCKCDKLAPTDSGISRENSYVDFRKTQKIYYDRSAPDKVEYADFKCRQGRIDSVEIISSPESTYAYLCERAIALKQPVHQIFSSRNQTTIFDLGGGQDQAYADQVDHAPNLFYVNEGLKYFKGGPGQNQFVLKGDCWKPHKAHLYGGIALNDMIDFEVNYCSQFTIRFTSTSDDALNCDLITNSNKLLEVSLYHIEMIQGRKYLPEYVIFSLENFNQSSSVKNIALYGAKSGWMDVISICGNSMGRLCGLNAKIDLFSFTELNSCAELGNINLKVKRPFQSISLRICITPNVFYNVSVESPSNEVSLSLVYETSYIYSYSLERKKGEVIMIEVQYVSLDVPFEKGFAIFFDEDGEDQSVLVLNEDIRKTVLHHRLSDTNTNSRIRRGMLNVANVFDIINPRWTAIGGNLPDDFILHDSNIESLDGGTGEDNITIHRNLFRTIRPNGYLEIDLDSGNKFKNIENVINKCPLCSRRLKVGCTTKYVYYMSVYDSFPYDILIPQYGDCSNRSLHIVTQGNTRVRFESLDQLRVKMEKNTTILLATSTIGEETFPSRLHVSFSVDAKLVANVVVIIKVKNTKWKWKSTKKYLANVIEVKFEDHEDQYVSMLLPYSPAEGIASPVMKIMKDETLSQVPLVIDNQYPYKVRVYHHLMGTNYSISSGMTTVQGFPYFSNIFRLLNGSYHCEGGTLGDIFNITMNLNQEVSIIGGEVQSNTDTFEDYNLVSFCNNPANSMEARTRLVINLPGCAMGFLNSINGTIKSVQNVIGRSNQPDTIQTACDTRFVAGRGSDGDNNMDLVVIRACKNKSRHITINVDEFTEVENTAEEGEFIYNVVNIENTALHLGQSVNTNHSIKYSFPIKEVIFNMQFEEKQPVLNLTLVGKRKWNAFKLSGITASGYYNNPQFHFQETGTSVLATLGIGNGGKLNVTYHISAGIWSHKDGNKLEGIPVEVNGFILEIDETHKEGGVIKGASRAHENHFWIRTLDSRLGELNGGNCTTGDTSKCTNSLHLEELKNDKPIHGKFDINGGRIAANDGIDIITTIKNINEVYGRKANVVEDKVFLSACDVRRIEGFKDITILQSRCGFNLTIKVDLNTTIIVMAEKGNDYSWNVNDTFMYKFSHPRSFDLIGDESWLGSTHIYILPFISASLFELRFDVESERLQMKGVGDSNMSLGMLSRPDFREEFYSQPIMVMKDNTIIRVSQSGSITLVHSNLTSFQHGRHLLSSGIESFRNMSKSLGVRLIFETDEELFHVWHDRTKVKDRAAIENTANKTSHLAGSGGSFDDDTIYFIRSLRKDVLIYTGFHKNQNCTKLENVTIFQTLDMTDIVVPIRISLEKKYIPNVQQKGSDLIITLEGDRKKYPGKIVIVNGTSPCVYKTLQIILHEAMMSLIPGQQTGSWKITPKEIKVPAGYVYNIAAQDLEDNHEITYESQIPQQRRTKREVRDVKLLDDDFEPAKMMNDLHVSNLAKVSDGDFVENDITTVIINDFFLPKGFLDIERGTVFSLPHTIRNVTVSLPGFKAILNGTQIKVYSNKTTAILQNDEIKDWGDLVNTVAARLNSKLPLEFQSTPSVSVVTRPAPPPPPAPRPPPPPPAPRPPPPPPKRIEPKCVGNYFDSLVQPGTIYCAELGKPLKLFG